MSQFLALFEHLFIFQIHHHFQLQAISRSLASKKRKERQVKKAKIREKVKNSIEDNEVPIESVIEGMDDDEADLDDLLDDINKAIAAFDEIDDAYNTILSKMPAAKVNNVLF